MFPLRSLLISSTCLALSWVTTQWISQDQALGGRSWSAGFAGAIVRNTIAVPLMTIPLLPAAETLAQGTCDTIGPCTQRCPARDSRSNPQSLPQTLPPIVFLPEEIPVTVVAQGSLACVNDRPLALPWIQVQTPGGSPELAVQDFALADGLGLVLLDSNSPQAQPIDWFPSPFPSASVPPVDQPLTLATILTPQSRYLNLSTLIRQGGWTATVDAGVQGNSLSLSIPPATVQALRLAQQGQGYRIVLEVDQPGLFTLQQDNDRWTLILEGALGESFGGSAMQSQFATFLQRDPVAQKLQLQVQTPLSPVVPSAKARSSTPETSRPQTYFTATVPQGLVPQVSRLTNPPRVVIDFLPQVQAFGTKTIAWAKGITWQQGWVRGKTKSFPVVWLTLDAKQWGDGFELRPLLPKTYRQSIAQLQGLSRLGEDTGAIVAVNAGYFNRNNQLPLGAIRLGGDWISGPILNRGVVGWTNRGTPLQFDRLSLRETLMITGQSTSQTIPLNHLNSGYVQGGMSRYTPSWGLGYSPLIDGETVLTVVGDRVTQVQRSGKAGTVSIPIPDQGYLLTARASETLARQLPVGTAVSLLQTYAPSTLQDYPNIVGAGPLLVKNSQVVLDAAGEGFSAAFSQQAALRTALGQTATGQILLATIALTPGGPVPTLPEMASLMISLGAVDAVNLDGGSSSSLYLGGKVLNRPPGTAARVHNGLGLVYDPE